MAQVRAGNRLKMPNQQEGTTPPRRYHDFHEQQPVLFAGFT
jgi:hypothetical protein